MYRVCPRCWEPVEPPDELCASHELRPVYDRTGEVLAHRFVLMKLIGLGTRNTTVWEANDAAEEGRAVAVKLCPPVDPHELSRSIHGTWVASRLEHRNVARVHEFGEADDGAFYCVMERLRGRTVQRLLESRPFRVPDVLRVTDQVLDGLGFCHAEGVLHRDIKTTNLFIAWDAPQRWRAVLLDFGISRYIDKIEPGDADDSKIVGTPEYMAPEQIVAGDLDARTDLYQLGVVLFRMLTGRLPFLAPTRRELYRAHLEQPPPPMGLLAPDRSFPHELEMIVRRLLAKDPRDRFADVSALREALAGVWSTLGRSKRQPMTRRLAIPARDAL